MVTLVLTWIGAVVGITLVLLMALGPVIVELDGWLSKRRQAAKDDKQAAAPVAARPVFH